MSDPVTNVEIEDVLSSIRRLVSEDARPRPTGPASGRADRLVLTPAQRVPDDTVASSATPEPAKDAVGQAASGVETGVAGLTENQPAELPEDELEFGHEDAPDDKIDDGPVLLTEPVMPEPEIPVARPAFDDDEADSDAASECEDRLDLGRLVQQEVSRALEEADTEQGEATETAGSAPESDDHGEPEPIGDAFAPADDETRADSEGDQRFAPEEARSEAETLWPTAPGIADQPRQPSLASSGSERLEDKIATLEAMIAKTSRSFEDDGGEDDPEGTAEPAPTFIHRHPEPAGWPRMDDQQGRPEATETDPAAVVVPGPHPKARPPAISEPSDDLSAEPAMIDEDILRDLVAEIVRQELQGALGERITRNVRKLVRREIHRVLMSQEFD